MDSANYVVDIMSRAPIVVGPETPVGTAASHAARHGVHYLLVIDGYRLRGVLCACDLQLAEPERVVADCMHAPPVTVDDQATGADCAELMRRRAVGCLPVVDWSGALAGVVTRHDLRAAGFAETDQRCASCGSSHSLVPDDFETGIVFCRHCLDHCGSVPIGDDDAYRVLGGGG